MEQMMTHLISALKEVENAVRQAESLKSKWKTSWGLMN